jgi:hypothetical protein
MSQRAQCLGLGDAAAGRHRRGAVIAPGVEQHCRDVDLHDLGFRHPRSPERESWTLVAVSCRFSICSDLRPATRLDKTTVPVA